MSSFFNSLKNRLFGKAKKAEQVKEQDVIPQATPVEKTEVEKREPAFKPSPSSVQQPKPQRDPYFIQIGFDFGTAFCKCVCRDISLDKAWVHILPDNENTEMPFLVASAVSFEKGSFQRVNNTHGAYEPSALNHVKMALQKVALKDLDDPVLQPYLAAASGIAEKNVRRFVGACSVYLLAGTLGNIKREISKRYPGKIENDYLAVNMAVPVADANHPGVNSLFNQILRIAWILADDLAEYPPITYKKLVSLIILKKEGADQSDIKEACFVYPEVSANVQGFIRSRTSSSGLYLFSDTGAGTVDQSVFLFGKSNGQDHLTYLHAGIFPLGSSLLERLAANEDGDASWKNLEHWRQSKESGEINRPLQTAKNTVHIELVKGTRKTIALSKKKLFSPRQINDLRVIFGGGGHCENPYRLAVVEQFDGDLFHPKEIASRRKANEPFDLGMPIPKDLQLKSSQRCWVDRLTVAYGLSFEKGQLATFRLPKDVKTPTEEQIWRPTRKPPHAPTKDDV